jgi:hypothetical protein
MASSEVIPCCSPAFDPEFLRIYPKVKNANKTNACRE